MAIASWGTVELAPSAELDLSDSGAPSMPPTFAELAARFLEWSALTLSPATVAYYRHHLDRFAAVSGAGPASDIKRHVLMSWARTWHEVQAVQRVYNWGVHDAELLDRNPFRTVRKPALGQRRRVLDRRTLGKLLRAAGRNFRAFLLTMRETLARPQEVRALRWEWLDWPTKPVDIHGALQSGAAVFVLDDYKSRKLRLDPSAPRVILITPRLGRMLSRRIDSLASLSGPVLTNDRGEPWSPNAVRIRMRNLRRRLQLGADHRGERVVAYTLRHTIATNAAAAGIRDKVLAEIMGHTSTRTTARYQHLQVEHLQAALRQLQRRGVE